MAGPFFIPDLSAHQGPSPDFGAIAEDPRMVGCILKATQGVTYAPAWFTQNWPRVRAVGGDRYGRSWFRGCYHFATPTPGGAAQADYLLAAVDRAGGWGDGDLAPAWDLEGAKWSSKQQIVDVSSAFAERVKMQLGRTPILYTGATWRQFNVTQRAGFQQLWSTHMDKMAAYGWPNDRYVLWQYAGTGKLYNPLTKVLGFPAYVEGINQGEDMNVVLDGGVPATSLERVRAVLTGLDALRDVPVAKPRGQSGKSMVPVAVGAALVIAGAIALAYASDDAH